uniref:Uncharacterized protein n=1 Tax=Cacopsylla melanoneura TaxID=428564 RepID=A0A8D8VQC5_9HEMI
MPSCLGLKHHSTHHTHLFTTRSKVQLAKFRHCRGAFQGLIVPRLPTCIQKSSIKADNLKQVTGFSLALKLLYLYIDSKLYDQIHRLVQCTSKENQAPAMIRVTY